MREEGSSRSPKDSEVCSLTGLNQCWAVIKNRITPSLGIRVVLRIDNCYSQKMLNTWFWIYIYITMGLKFLGKKIK
jgi:hypothetical protein